MIKSCKCKSEFQDQEHGKGQRVHTQSIKEEERCTVCGPVQRKVERLKLHAKNHIKQVHG